MQEHHSDGLWSSPELPKNVERKGKMRKQRRWESNPLHGRQLYQPSQSPIKDRSQEKPGVHTLEKISTLMSDKGFAFCRARRGYSWEEGLLDTVIPYSVLNPTQRSKSQMPWLRTELITANLLFQLQWPFHSIATPLKYHQTDTKEHFYCDRHTRDHNLN